MGPGVQKQVSASAALILLLAAWLGTAGAAEATSPGLPAPAAPAGFEGRPPLDAEDYQRKKEGRYVTGLPLLNFDSNTGVGLGARGYYYSNGRRNTALFAYTPYLYRVFLQALVTTGGLQYHWADVDVPTVAETPFRIRAQMVVQRNTDQHYFGIGQRTMGALNLSGDPRRFSHFSAYQAALDSPGITGQTHSRYNSYRLTQPMLLVSLERTSFGGLFRPLLGFGISYNQIHDYTASADTPTPAVAPTRLHDDCQARILVGCSGGWNNFFRFGVSLDTRDYEPDPNRGLFVDAALDLGSRALGSRYEWARALLSPRVYFDPLRTLLDLVFAARATFLVQSASSPFFAMNYWPYTDDPRTGLGGLRTLRGYKQDRFVGPVMTLVNAEVRWTFVHFRALDQEFAMIGVPFVDLGAVFDSVRQIQLGGWRRDQGLALRVSWNLATIVTTEYAVSEEDHAFYVNFNHIF